MSHQKKHQLLKELQIVIFPLSQNEHSEEFKILIWSKLKDDMYDNIIYCLTMTQDLFIVVEWLCFFLSCETFPSECFMKFVKPSVSTRHF